MKSFVSISNDRSLAVTTHASIAGAPTACAEALVPMFWPPGLVTGKNQLTHTVFHQGLPICQAKHDIGPLIPHACIPPNLAGDDLATANSFRKHLFSSSRHRANGKFLAACGLMNLAPTPALACAVPVPLANFGNVTMALLNRVTFTLTPSDILAGVGRMAEEMVVRAIGSATGEKGRLVGWAFMTLADNARNIGHGVYDYVMEDGPVEIEFRVNSPVASSHWSVGFGMRRGEEGEHGAFGSAKLAGRELGAEMEIGWPPKLPDPYFKTHAEGDNGDVIVHKEDGKAYRYKGGDWDEVLRSPERPDDWGKVTPEDDD